jgi:hypothetical protein
MGSEDTGETDDGLDDLLGGPLEPPKRPKSSCRPTPRDRARRIRRRRIRIALMLLLPLLVVVTGMGCMIGMPGESYRGEFAALDAAGRASEARLRADVAALCAIGPNRNQFVVEGLRQAEAYIAGEFRKAGYTPKFHEYECYGETVRNIEVELAGTSKAEEIVIIGGHYDSCAHVDDGQGADDNASGTAGVLELARLMAQAKPARTIRFVAFVNEEPPFFQQPGEMGSEVYAARCKERGEKVVAMLSIEMIGYFSTEPGSQHYPAPLSWFYPDTGDFIAFVGTFGNRRLVKDCIKVFRTEARFPSEGAALPSFLSGVEFSDHWSFRRHGYPAAMVTDTAFFRNHHYHTDRDTPAILDFDRMTRVVQGLVPVVDHLANRDDR